MPAFFVSPTPLFEGTLSMMRTLTLLVVGAVFEAVVEARDLYCLSP